MKSGLDHIQPDSRDYSIVRTFGAVTTDPEGLPASFSIYGNQAIPNQEQEDTRFAPSLPPLPYGCTGETGAFESGIQDAMLYDPQDLYYNTPPGGPGGRDIRAMLSTLKTRGPRAADGSFGPKRANYFNCYGSGKIDDFDAARIGLWINQYEKRGVYIGSYWYWGDHPAAILSTPSFNTNQGTLHCYLAVGWGNDGGEDYLLVIPWIGQQVGNSGVFKLSRTIYNALLAQPYTGAFTITKQGSQASQPVGYQANLDHIVALLTQFIRNLFSA